MKPLGATTRTWLESAAKGYYSALRDSPAQEYLQARGISGESAQRFRLGYSGAGEPIGMEQFRNHLSIPYLADGHVVSIKFRNLGEGVKYGQPTGQVARLFNVGALLRAGHYIMVTEGELDAISLEQVGVPAVGITGVTAWKSHHARLFEGFETVLVFKDDDEPKPTGRTNPDGSPVMRVPSDELIARLRDAELPVVVVKATSGFKDPNEMLAAGLGDDLRGIVEAAL